MVQQITNFNAWKSQLASSEQSNNYATIDAKMNQFKLKEKSFQFFVYHNYLRAIKYTFVQNNPVKLYIYSKVNKWRKQKQIFENNLLMSAEGQRPTFFSKKKKKKKENVNFDFKGVQKFFETANGLETLSIMKPICELSESFYRIKIWPIDLSQCSKLSTLEIYDSP